MNSRVDFIGNSYECEWVGIIERGTSEYTKCCPSPTHRRLTPRGIRWHVSLLLVVAVRAIGVEDAIEALLGATGQ